MKWWTLIVITVISLLHFTLVAPFLSSLMKLCLLRIRESKLKIDIVELTFHQNRCEIPNLIVQCRISTMKWIIRSCLYREREEGSMCGYEHQFVAPLSFYLNKIIWQDQLPLHFNSLKKKIPLHFLVWFGFYFFVSFTKTSLKQNKSKWDWLFNYKKKKKFCTRLPIKEKGQSFWSQTQ